jgi:hypothetical protein
MSIEAFEGLRRRIFLDSCTLQGLRDYGGFIWESEPIDEDDKLHAVNQGYANVYALREIFLVNQRALFEWVVSEASLVEAGDKRDPGHLQWAYDVLDHTLACLQTSGGPTVESQAAAKRLQERRFGYLSEKDRLLIQDALLLRCDGFLTMEQRLPRNADHIQREVGLRVLTPVQYWELLKPWAALYA